MRVVIITILAILPITGYGFPKKVLEKFKTIELPFLVDYATFDIYACDDNMVVLEENTIKEFLLSETDDFLIRKSEQNLVQSTYHDYFSVGKIKKNEYTIVLYYRNYETTNDVYGELMACVLNSKLKLLQTISLSRYDTQNGYYSLCKMNENCDITIYRITEEAVKSNDMNLDGKEECQYVMQKEKNNLPFQIIKIKD